MIIFALSDVTNLTKPSIIKVQSGGKAIEVELWGFICEEYGKEDVEDITMTGGWRNII